MPEFSYQHQSFDGFYRGEVRSDGTLIEWERDVDVLVAIYFLPPHFEREECCQIPEAAIQGRYEK